MTKVRALSVLVGLALAGISIAHADTTLTGAWKLTTGANGAPCTLTLTADGTAAEGTDCAGGLAAVGHWRAVGEKLQLLSPSGNLVASLRSKGDAYEGTRVEDGRKVALTR